jgi:transcriptional pleiotropic regulator of transition state genes
MRATGIIRRIDDLGRLVVSKNIREQLNIETGDAFEIFIDINNDTIMFKKIKLTNTDNENTDDENN